MRRVYAGLVVAVVLAVLSIGTFGLLDQHERPHFEPDAIPELGMRFNEYLDQYLDQEFPNLVLYDLLTGERSSLFDLRGTRALIVYGGTKCGFTRVSLDYYYSNGWSDFGIDHCVIVLNGDAPVRYWRMYRDGRGIAAKTDIPMPDWLAPISWAPMHYLVDLERKTLVAWWTQDLQAVRAQEPQNWDFYDSAPDWSTRREFNEELRELAVGEPTPPFFDSPQD